MNKIGKIGRANKEARDIIAQISEERNLTYCEIRLPGKCLGTYGLAPAHRHKRVWYNGSVEKLSDPKQWVAGCQGCHDTIEDSRTLTEEVFMRLRGPE